jgi:uncharacterized protein
MDTPDPSSDSGEFTPRASEQFTSEMHDGPPRWAVQSETNPRKPPGGGRPHPGFWLALLAGVTAYATVLVIAEMLGLGNEFRLIAASGLEYLPFVPLCLLAYAGQRSAPARTFTAVYWLIIVCGTSLVVFLLTVQSLVGGGTMQALWRGDSLLVNSLRSAAGSLFLIPLTLYGIGFGVLIGLLGFLPAVRRRAALILPIDPDSFVHATALATVLGLTAIAFVPLLVLGDPPLLLLTPMLGEMKQKQAEMQADAEELRGTVYGFLWLVPCTIVGVGYPLRRTFRGALQRLGLVRPTNRQLILAVLLIPALLGAINGIDTLIDRVWGYFNWPRTNEKEFNELMRFALNPAGPVIIGVTAGLGEELVVRGMLQPRLGIILSNVFFASLHALQYNWDSLAMVFFVGLTLGVVRKYTNTTTSAIVHGGYDFVLVLLDVIQKMPGGS